MLLLRNNSKFSNYITKISEANSFTLTIMRRPSLSRTKGSIKDAEFIKLISIDQYEFAIEKTIIRRHSTIISTLLTDFGVGNTQEDLQILQPALTPPVSSENDTVK